MASKLTAQAATGAGNPKFVRTRRSDGAFWNTSGTPAFETYSAGNIASYGIAATETGSTGYYTATDPADSTDGDYLFVAAAGASLAVTDLANNVQWTGEVNENIVSVSGAVGSVTGSVGSISGVTFPSNFSSLSINGSGHIVLADGSLVTAKLGTFALAKTTNITGFNDLSAAQVNAEADTALSDVGLTTTVTGRIDAAISSRSTITTAEVNTEVDQALVDINLDHLLKVAAVTGDVTNSSVIARMTSKSATPNFSSFDNTTDSQEAIADNAGGGVSADVSELKHMVATIQRTNG